MTREPKLYLNRYDAQRMLEAFPSLEGRIEVLGLVPEFKPGEWFNQKRPADDFKPNRKMRRKNLTLWKKSG